MKELESYKNNKDKLISYKTNKEIKDYKSCQRKFIYYKLSKHRYGEKIQLVNHKFTMYGERDIDIRYMKHRKSKHIEISKSDIVIEFDIFTRSFGPIKKAPEAHYSICDLDPISLNEVKHVGKISLQYREDLKW